ncbi:hypothetical protein Tco_1313044 [Tanacetum coccineum]
MWIAVQGRLIQPQIDHQKGTSGNQMVCPLCKPALDSLNTYSLNANNPTQNMVVLKEDAGPQEAIPIISLGTAIHIIKRLFGSTVLKPSCSPVFPFSKIVEGGGTAFNGVVEELKKLTTSVAHVLPVSDDGGSTAEIVRVLALSAVRSIADTDPSHRKLFIRGIGWDTTTSKPPLKSVFTNQSLCLIGAVKALVEPSKKIDGRITVAQLASAKDSTASNVDGRKVYVGKCLGKLGVMCKMAVDGKKERAGGGMMSPRGPVPGIVNTGTGSRSRQCKPGATFNTEVRGILLVAGYNNGGNDKAVWMLLQELQFWVAAPE